MRFQSFGRAADLATPHSQLLSAWESAYLHAVNGVHQIMDLAYRLGRQDDRPVSAVRLVAILAQRGRLEATMRAGYILRRRMPLLMALHPLGHLFATVQHVDNTVSQLSYLSMVFVILVEHLAVVSQDCPPAPV